MEYHFDFVWRPNQQMEQQPTDAWEDGIRHCTRRGYEVPSDTTADQKVGEGSEGGFLYLGMAFLKPELR